MSGDVATGAVLVVAGAAALARPRSRATGALLCATGAAWFAGSAAEALVFLHRGPLFHLLLAYPHARVRGRIPMVVAPAAYATALVEPAGASAPLTAALAALVTGAAVARWLGAGGTERRAARSAAAAAVAVCSTLGAGVLGFDDAAVLIAYELAVSAAAAGLAADVLAGGWAGGVITGLLDLGRLERATPVAEAIGRAVGDPSLVIALPGGVDEAGRPVPPAAADAIPIGDGAVLVHDPAALADPELARAAAAAARLALANAKLQDEVADRVEALAASARRLVTASDDERRRLERVIEERAERRVAAAEALLAADPELARAAADARAQLRRFAAGIRPPRLADDGLGGALEELAARAPLPVEIRVDGARYEPVVEASIYFVCSEALANVAKYASARSARVWITERDGALIAEVADDGAGGARLSGGSGLRGLADRVGALGGRLTVESTLGRGTTVRAEIPVTA
jgi:signal transduction histidine kinase